MAEPGIASDGGKGVGDGPLLAGRWRLGARLGAGAQAETYLATEVARRIEVVVKRVKLGAGWKSFELHEREVKVLGQLRHPGVPRLLGAVEEPTDIEEVKTSDETVDFGWTLDNYLARKALREISEFPDAHP